MWAKQTIYLAFPEKTRIEVTSGQVVDKNNGVTREQTTLKMWSYGDPGSAVSPGFYELVIAHGTEADRVEFLRQLGVEAQNPRTPIR